MFVSLIANKIRAYLRRREYNKFAVKKRHILNVSTSHNM